MGKEGGREGRQQQAGRPNMETCCTPPCGTKWQHSTSAGASADQLPRELPQQEEASKAGSEMGQADLWADEQGQGSLKMCLTRDGFNPCCKVVAVEKLVHSVVALALLALPHLQTGRDHEVVVFEGHGGDTPLVHGFVVQMPEADVQRAGSMQLPAWCELPPPSLAHLCKVIHKVVGHVIVHPIRFVAELIQGVQEAAKHCSIGGQGRVTKAASRSAQQRCAPKFRQAALDGSQGGRGETGVYVTREQ
jgi:hypothetical protein